MSAAVHAYCAKHPGMSCQMYKGDALRCESPAYGAIPVVQTVAMWKFQHGMSTTQAVRFATLADPSGENAEIAAWAGRFIDVSQLKPSDPVNMMARFFATEVVLKTCLANIQ